MVAVYPAMFFHSVGEPFGLATVLSLVRQGDPFSGEVFGN